MTKDSVVSKVLSIVPDAPPRPPIRLQPLLILAAAAIMLLAGLASSPRGTLNLSLVLKQVDDQYRGLVRSVFMMSFGLASLSAIPVGIAAAILGERPAVAILGAMLLTATLAISASQKGLRELP